MPVSPRAQIGRARERASAAGTCTGRQSSQVRRSLARAGVIANMTSAALPGHDPATSGCTDFVVGPDIGELAPGHRLVVRGGCLDIDGRLWLHYALTPGLSEAKG